jgi:antitoxin component YwqK of YwqJK toxin-antitoxin module
MKTDAKKSRPWVIVALLVLGGLALLALRPERSVALEVPRNELTLRDGRLYLTNGIAPFRGIMIDAYPGGAISSRSEVVDGKLHGLSEGWHTNGQLQVVEHFREGVSHGARTKWRADGSKLSEAQIVQGKMEGMFRTWHENGELAEEMQMSAGAVHGSARAFYPSGYMKTLARLTNGSLLEKSEWKDQEMKAPESSNN